MRHVPRASPAARGRPHATSASGSAARPAPRSRAGLQSALLAWFDRHRRPLPWRETRDPYRIWIAEVMLQQTRVAVVERAYPSFLRAFPDLGALAAASEDEVLSYWSGLGYYTRARALHRAARAIRAAGGTTFPDSAAAARSLPGVGEYTATAVLSIAYGVPLAAVDGNVVRVLARLERLGRPGASGEPHRSFAEQLLRRDRPGDWNQALMELGEVICTPAAPRCARCPVTRWCRARKEDAVHLHPPPKPRRAVERIDVELTLLSDRSGRLLLERGAFPYLRHLWLPPMRLASRRARGGDGARRATFKHAILHRELRVRVDRRLLRTDELRRHARRSARDAERRLFSREELAAIGRSALLTKALALTPHREESR